MNIFFLDKDPSVCAEMHCDKHVSKMIIEYAQMLSTAHRVLDEDVNEKATVPYIDKLYKKTHVNHPSTVWVRSDWKNYFWTYQLFTALCKQYTIRYNKKHLTDIKLSFLLMLSPYNIPKTSALDEMTPPPLCMPDEYKCDNHVEAYRNFYNGEKARFAKWDKLGKVPYWFAA